MSSSGSTSRPKRKCVKRTPRPKTPQTESQTESETSVSDTEMAAALRPRRSVSSKQPASQPATQRPQRPPRPRPEDRPAVSDPPQPEDLDQLSVLIQGMSTWANSQYKSQKLTRDQVNALTTRMTEMSALLSRVTKKVSFLEGRLDERLRIESSVQTSPVAEGSAGRTSYASVAKVPKVTGATRPMKPPRVVFIKSKDKNDTIDTIKERVKATLNPGRLGINIQKVKKTARGLLIETEKESHLAALENNADLKAKGLVVEKPRRKQPRIMIYDVEPDDSAVTIQEIFDRNVAEAIPYEEFLDEFKCVHKYTHRGSDTRENWVVECSPRVRNLIRVRDRLFIGWQSCRVKDYNPVVRCYKCQTYGHVGKYCRNKQVCPHCTGEHDLKNCKRKDQSPRCANCRAANREYHHDLTSTKCPEYERAVRIAYEKVDYGH